MKVVLKVGDEIVGRPIPTEEVMTPPRRKIENKLGLVVKISGGNIAPAEETAETKEPEVAAPVVNAGKPKSDKKTIKPGVSKEKKEAIENIEKSTESKFIPKEDPKVAAEEEDTIEAPVATKPEDNGVIETIDTEAADEETKAEVDVEEEDAIEPATAAPAKPSIEDKYMDMYDDDYYDDGSSFRGRQPIRKKNTVERDANGRFVSTKNGSNKKKNNRIPSNK